MRASAPAKLILCGEHAVVYGRPAIALPLASIRARATVAAGVAGLRIVAPDLGRSWRAADAPDDALSALCAATLAQLGAAGANLTLTISSDIPIASGMGSGAAVATAIVRALAAHYGQALPPAAVSALVYQSERRLHGTPSGIDNAVIAYERPIWFQRSSDSLLPLCEPGQAGEGHTASIAPISIAQPFTLIVADTGLRSATSEPVGAVRRAWQAQPARYEALFDQIGALAFEVRAALARGAGAALGPLLSANHALLQSIGVSSPALDRLVLAARVAGALGAKLSGAGWGGVMLALASADAAAPVAAALAAAGATRVLTTTVDATAAGDLPL